MPFTERQLAAEAALEAAIRERLEADVEAGRTDSRLLDFHLADWLIVYSAEHAEDSGRVWYGRLHTAGALPAHSALGLMELARHRIKFDGWVDGDDTEADG